VNTRSEKGLATRDRIVGAATRLFTAAGYEGTSIEDLLGELQISRGALYHHFNGKEELFEAVLERVEADIAQATKDATAGISDPVIALRTGVDAFLRMARDETVKRVVLIDAPAVLGWEKWREIDARHGFGLMKASLKAAAKKKRLRAELIEIYAHILLAGVMETALVIARADDSEKATRNGRTAIAELINKLLDA
jgi:AcrR family transcriptional regulator